MNIKYLLRVMRKSLICFFILLLQYGLVQYSCIEKATVFFEQSIRVMMMSLLILFAFNGVLNIFFQKWSITLAVSSIVLSVWSIANYFTIRYHGSPLFLSEISNVSTAMNVLGQYSYAIDIHIKMMFVLIVPMLLFSLIFIILERKEDFFHWKRWLINTCVSILSIVLIYVGLFKTNAIKPVNTMTWHWKVGVEQYGIVTCMIEDVDKIVNYLNEPKGYTVAAVDGIDVNDEKGTKTPDVILILNETFYDLDDYVDTKSDVDYMKNFYNIEGAIYGKAISPNIGGGTNNSEFEYLTSNSMYLLKNYAPFNYIDLSENRNNIVGHLNAHGYTSVGMHCAVPSNYHRHVAYPAIGFNDVILGPEQFTREVNGNRPWTDAGIYKDLERYYESMEKGPRFLYMLTLQNHGGYEQNDPSMDTVHAKRDFGDLNDEVDEYLSSLKLSADAFKELIDYYKKVDRPVVIVMVGDHAPSFIQDLDVNEINDTKETLIQRSVPYVIWANFDLKTEGMYTNYASMIDLVPMMLEMTDMPMTTYQQYVLERHNQLPVITKEAEYLDKNGQTGSIFDSEYEDLVMKYYYMEYNALKGGKDYCSELFEQ